MDVNWHLNEKNLVEQRLNYLRAEYIQEQSKDLGFRILTALFWENIQADAIVIPDFKIHKTYISKKKRFIIRFCKKTRSLFKKK